MKKKLTVIIVSLVFAMFIISGGYGYWSETLTVEGTITIYPPQSLVEKAEAELMLRKTELLNAGLDSNSDLTNNGASVGKDTTEAMSEQDEAERQLLLSIERKQQNEGSDDVVPAEDPDIEEPKDEPIVETDSNLQSDN